MEVKYSKQGSRKGLIYFKYILLNLKLCNDKCQGILVVVLKTAA
jgi:hypothetical protein